jgi:hypothetical protein
LIKINLVREGRAVRGAGAAPAAVSSVIPGAGPNFNNILLLGLIGLALLLSAAYWFINKRTLSNRQEMVTVRKAEAQKLEAIIAEVEAFQRRKDSLQARIDLINQLKQNQKGPVRIMDRISQDLPDLVWLDRMNVAGGTITLNGRGLNPNAIANFVETSRTIRTSRSLSSTTSIRPACSPSCTPSTCRSRLHISRRLRAESLERRGPRPPARLQRLLRAPGRRGRRRRWLG